MSLAETPERANSFDFFSRNRGAYLPDRAIGVVADRGRISPPLGLWQLLMGCDPHFSTTLSVCNSLGRRFRLLIMSLQRANSPASKKPLT